MPMFLSIVVPLQPPNASSSMLVPKTSIEPGLAWLRHVTTRVPARAARIVMAVSQIHVMRAIHKHPVRPGSSVLKDGQGN